MLIIEVVIRTLAILTRLYNTIGHSIVASCFQSEANCEAIDLKMTLYSHANKTHFHNISFALRFVLKVRAFGTQKWPTHCNAV